jgi:hypothetical protein
MKKIMIIACLCGIACMLLATVPATGSVGSYPTSGTTVTCSGTFRNISSTITMPATWTVVYTTGNDSNHLNIACTATYSGNGSTIYSGSGVEYLPTRVMTSSSGFMAPVGTHFIRANPSEITGGIGATLLMVVDGQGDATHTISSEGSMSVGGVTINYWVASGTKDDYVQTVKLEKTTGMLVAFMLVYKGVTTMDFTATSATNITPDAQSVPGYMPALILAIAGILVVFLWKRKITSH